MATASFVKNHKVTLGPFICPTVCLSVLFVCVITVNRIGRPCESPSVNNYQDQAIPLFRVISDEVR